MIASHYAEPLLRHIIGDTELRLQASSESEAIGTVIRGDEFRLLDCSLGWAWGYASDGRVGYVTAKAVGA